MDGALLHAPAWESAPAYTGRVLMHRLFGYPVAYDAHAHILRLIPAGSQPDPTDPATAGCLLALLGPRALAQQHRDFWEVSVPRDLTDTVPRHIGASAATLGAACIAVAEACGKWPGSTSPP